MSGFPFRIQGSGHACLRAAERFGFTGEDVREIALACAAREPERLTRDDEAHRIQHKGKNLVAIFRRGQGQVVTLLAEDAIVDGRLKVKASRRAGARRTGAGA